MVQPTRPPKNGFNAFARKIYNPLGFSKAYNFILWFIFGGALLGFCLARFTYLDYNGHLCPRVSTGANSAAPGECYYYNNFSRYKIGILLHLAGVLPAGVLAVVQFTPFIRHKWILAHRINGYIALTLYLAGSVGALMIGRRAFGGSIETQVAVWLLGIGIPVCFGLAIYNIKKLQIEQHRAWMLRGWFYASVIITLRIIMVISSSLISNRGYYTVWSCAKIASVSGGNSKLLSEYPACEGWVNGTNPDQVAIVKAAFGSSAASTGAAMNMTFGMAFWLALILHAVGVEVYLHLTPKEAYRLRQVSYQRQLEAGMRHPGSAGLTADRLGDAVEFVPQVRKDSDTTLADSVHPRPSTTTKPA